MKKLGQIGLAIFAVALLSASSFLITKHAWLSSLTQNVGCSIIAALIVIWSYDQLLEREAQRVSRERNELAAKQLVQSLRSHIYGFLFPMYRSAVKERDDHIVDWEDFLINKLPRDLPHLDMTSRSPDSYPMVTPYPKSISGHMKHFCKVLQDWLAKYGSTIDNDLFNSCENVASSSFAFLSSHLEESCNFHPPGFPQSFSLAANFQFNEDQVRDYGSRLNALIKAIENALGERISVFEDIYWRNELLEIGYARRADKAPASKLS